MRSSEFWRTAVAQVLPLLVLFGVLDLDVANQEAIALAVSGMIEAGYAIARGLAKSRA
jgi:hypothetical protein